MSIDHLVASYGYVAVFVLVAVESLGVPLPGETALIAAATYAGARHASGAGHAHLVVWGIFLAGAVAAILGDTIGYWIGDVGGFRLLRRYGHYVRLDEPKVKVARYLFARHGGAVVFFGRFVSVLRTYAAFLAGTTRMRYRRFLVFNASGGIVWAAVYTFAAYYAGAGLSRVSGTLTVVFVVVAVVVLLAAILVVRRRFAALQAAAEEAFPGPLYAGRGSSRRDPPGTGPAGPAGSEVPADDRPGPAGPAGSEAPGSEPPGSEPPGSEPPGSDQTRDGQAAG